MPNLSPLGGFSLLVHVSINVVVFCYRKIVYIFNISKTNVVSRSASRLYNKEGDTTLRHVFSYILVSCVVFVICGNAVLISVLLLNFYPNFLHTESSKVIILQGTLSFPDTSLETIPSHTTESPIETPVKNSMATSIRNLSYLGDATVKRVTSASFISLVDFLNVLGSVSSSFETRAELAQELNIVAVRESYTGSASQNKTLLSDLKEHLNTARKTNTIVSN